MLSGQVFLGRDLGQGQSYSDVAAEKIDAEVGNFLMQARKRAESQIEANREKLTLLANRLLAEETIEGDELEVILADTAGDGTVAAYTLPELLPDSNSSQAGLQSSNGAQNP